MIQTVLAFRFRNWWAETKLCFCYKFLVLFTWNSVLIWNSFSIHHNNTMTDSALTPVPTFLTTCTKGNTKLCAHGLRNTVASSMQVNEMVFLSPVVVLLSHFSTAAIGRGCIFIFLFGLFSLLSPHSNQSRLNHDDNWYQWHVVFDLNYLFLYSEEI